MSRVAQENMLLILLGVTALVGGIFITKDECPPNEEYLLCGSACPFNCSNPEGPVTCGEECAEGCFCKAGYLRHLNGTCVNADMCGVNNTICGANEEFLSCGPACLASCSQPVPVCDLVCSMGCFCKAGFVRDDATNSCVSLDQCPVEQCLNDNEIYDACNAACEPTCADPEPICTTICTGGCVCAPGLLRNDSGDCVAVDRCTTNGTDPGLLGKYLDVINRILRLNSTSFNLSN